MALNCNIDSRGRRARLIYGIAMVLVGLTLSVFWAAGSDSAVRWTIAAGCVLAGAFGIFEARAGWCAIRAMGIRTPM